MKNKKLKLLLVSLAGLTMVLGACSPVKKDPTDKGDNTQTGDETNKISYTLSLGDNFSFNGKKGSITLEGHVGDILPLVDEITFDETTYELLGWYKGDKLVTAVEADGDTYVLKFNVKQVGPVTPTTISYVLDLGENFKLGEETGRVTKEGKVGDSLPTNVVSLNEEIEFDGWYLGDTKVGTVQKAGDVYVAKGKAVGNPVNPDPVEIKYSVLIGNESYKFTEIDADQEGMVKQFEAAIPAVTEGQKVQFIYDGNVIESEIGPDQGDNNIIVGTDGFYVHNSAENAHLYFKVWEQGYSFYLTGFVKGEDPVGDVYKLYLGEEEFAFTEIDADQEGMLKQFKVELAEVHAGDVVAFIKNGERISGGIGPDAGDNNIVSTENGFFVHNDAKDATIYFKVWEDGGFSFWVTGYEKGEDPVEIAYKLYFAQEEIAFTEMAADQEGMVKQYKAELAEVHAGDMIAFLRDGERITSGIGPDSGENNVDSTENGFFIHNDAKDVTVYLKVWKDGGLSFWVTGYVKGEDPVPVEDVYKLYFGEEELALTEMDVDAEQENMVKQFKVELAEVHAGDMIAFIKNGERITSGIGPDTGDNNVDSSENGFFVHNDAKEVTVYLKVWKDGGLSFWVTGYVKGEDPIPVEDVYKLYFGQESLALTEIDADQEGMVKQFKVELAEVHAGDMIAFIKNDERITTGIGPDAGDNNVDSTENGFFIHNDAKDVTVYLKVWENGGLSFWVTGYVKGEDPVPVEDVYKLYFGQEELALTEIDVDAEQENMVKQFKVELAEVHAGDMIAFIKNEERITTGIGPDSGENNVDSTENGFFIHNDAKEVTVYLKVWKDGGLSFWVTGYVKGEDPVVTHEYFVTGVIKGVSNWYGENFDRSLKLTIDESEESNNVAYIEHVELETGDKLKVIDVPSQGEVKWHGVASGGDNDGNYVCSKTSEYTIYLGKDGNIYVVDEKPNDPEPVVTHEYYVTGEIKGVNNWYGDNFDRSLKLTLDESEESNNVAYIEHVELEKDDKLKVIDIPSQGEVKWHGVESGGDQDGNYVCPRTSEYSIYLGKNGYIYVVDEKPNDPDPVEEVEYYITGKIGEKTNWYNAQNPDLFEKTHKLVNPDEGDDNNIAVYKHLELNINDEIKVIELGGEQEVWHGIKDAKEGESDNFVCTAAGLYTVYLSKDSFIYVVKEGSEDPTPDPEPVEETYSVKIGEESYALTSVELKEGETFKAQYVVKLNVEKDQELVFYKGEAALTNIGADVDEANNVEGNAETGIKVRATAENVNLYLKVWENGYSVWLEGYQAGEDPTPDPEPVTFKVKISIDVAEFQAWDPAGTGFSIYAWGAQDYKPLGSWDECKGNLKGEDGKLSLEFEATSEITNVIFYFTQGNETKQTVDIACSIKEAGNYKLVYKDNATASAWVQDGGVYKISNMELVKE